MVQSDVDLVAVCLDEKSHEEAAEGVSSVPGRDWAESLQETIAHPSQRNNGLVKCLEIILKQGSLYWGKIWQRM